MLGFDLRCDCHRTDLVLMQTEGMSMENKELATLLDDRDRTHKEVYERHHQLLATLGAINEKVRLILIVFSFVALKYLFWG